MKKKVIIMLLAVITLVGISACGTIPEDSVRTEPPETTSDAEEKKEEKPLNTEYTTEVVGVPELNENGEVLGDCHFEKLVFTNTNDSLEKINRTISEKCKEYFTSGNGKGFYGYFNELSEEQKLELVEYPYIANVYMDEDYLSIEMQSQWYCGGVFSKNSSGLNFDLHSGKLISVSALFSSPEAAKDAVVRESIRYIDTAPNQQAISENAKETIKNYDISKLEFCFDQEYICVFYRTYELGDGYLGPVTVLIKR